MKYKSIQSANNLLIKEFMSYKNNRNSEFFIVDKLNMIEELMNTNLITTIVCSNIKLMESFYTDKIKYIHSSQEIIDKLSFVENNKGIVAIIKKTDVNNLFKNKKDYNKVIYIDDVQDPGNAGSIVRTACAFNFDKVYFSSRSIDIFNDKLIRATQGAFFKVPMERVESIDEITGFNNYEVVALENKKESINIENFKMNMLKGLVLVLGNEGYGVNENTKEFVNVSIKIPIDNLESINVAAAAAIAIYKMR
jgi:TrmH family RNA methyltransferase